MKKLFEKIKSIRFWWLGIPVLVVVVGVVISAFGGGLLEAFKKKEPEPFNYLTDEQAKNQSERIKDHRDAQNKNTGKTADEVRNELDDMLNGGGSSNG